MPKKSELKNHFKIVKDGQALPNLKLTPGDGGRVKAEGAVLVQCTGMLDADKRPVYCHDVLELEVTKDMLDPSRNTFAGSNLGRWLSKNEPDVKAVYLILHETEYLGFGYNLYAWSGNGLIRDADGRAEEISGGSGHMFPLYLIEKGARVLTDTDASPDILAPGMIEAMSCIHAISNKKEGKDA